jgi:low temperature requirement protein LtrA
MARANHVTTPHEQSELRVSNLELFFDLVFVFTITQLTALIELHPSLGGVAGAALVFVVMYWMYGGYAWLTNQVPPTSTPRRLLLVGGMAAFLICALAIPQAFNETGFAFAIGYVLVVLVHSGLYAQNHGATVWRFVPFNLLGAACLVAAAFVNGWERYALWVATVVLNYTTARLSGRVRDSESSGFAIRADHFVERHGLLLIIVFGESIVAIGIALANTTLSAKVYGAAVLGLGLAASLWWLYFMKDPQRSEKALVAAPVATRVRLALAGYFYAYIPILFGIVLLAAGLGHAVSHITDPLPPEYAILLGVGTALYLLGAATFRFVFGIRPIAPRLVASVVAVVTAFAGMSASALLEVGLLIATVVGLLAVESQKSRGTRTV